MGRGIERRKIFPSDTDRNDFIGRLSVKLRGDGRTPSTCCLFSVTPTIQERIICDMLEKVLIRAAGRNWSAED